MRNHMRDRRVLTLRKRSSYWLGKITQRCNWMGENNQNGQIIKYSIVSVFLHCETSLSYKLTERQASASSGASDWIPLKYIVMLENGSQTHSQASQLTCIIRPCRCRWHCHCRWRLTLGVFMPLRGSIFQSYYHFYWRNANGRNSKWYRTTPPFMAFIYTWKVSTYDMKHY